MIRGFYGGAFFKVAYLSYRFDLFGSGALSVVNRHALCYSDSRRIFLSLSQFHYLYYYLFCGYTNKFNFGHILMFVNNAVYNDARVTRRC